MPKLVKLYTFHMPSLFYVKYALKKKNAYFLPSASEWIMLAVSEMRL